MKRISSLLTITRLAFILAVGASATVSLATPYATSITNNAGSVSYILNENADNVKIVFDSGTVTNDNGALSKGVQLFSLGAHTNYAIYVYKSNTPAWTKTSVDTNPLLLFGNGRGITVNQSAKDTRTFGRVYIVNSLAGFATNPVASISRTMGKGLFVLNADLSDALGQGANAIVNGMNMNASNTDPWKLGFGRDDHQLYVNLFASANAATYQMDPELTNSVLVISPQGNNATHYDPANTPIVTGTLADGNLTLYNVEGSRPGAFNKVARWDIASGPLPAAVSPTILGWTDHNTANLGVAGLNTDIEMGPDGKIYTSINRSAGTDTACVQVFDTDGLTILWDSRTAGGQPDVYRLIRAIAISPDGTKLAAVRDGGTVVVVTLTNGIPDLSSMNTFPGNEFTTGAVGATSRDLSYDAAGNIYVIGGTNASYALYGVKAYSPGGVTTAVTANDLTGTNGTFTLVQGTPTVSLAATQPIASEDGTPGTFTISRTGDTSSSLTVYYTITGTATNGVDYATIATPAVIPAAASSVNVTVTPIQDSIAEATETVVLTAVDNTNYFVTSRTGIVIINDTNLPVLSVTGISASMYERITNDYVTVSLRRDLGNTNVSVTLSDPGAFSFGGTAVMNVDYVVNSNLFPLTFNFGDRAASVRLISPLDDSLLKGNRTVIIGMVSGADYTAATNVTTTTIIEDEVPAETILFSDNFNVDVPGSWKTNFGSLNSAAAYTVEFAYDYGASVPTAPHSSGDTLGLHLNVNKDGLGAAGVNLYPTNQSFGTNFALRFDMYLFTGASGTTEYSIFGVNHSGNQTNWFRSSGNGFTNSAYDGLFFSVESDASGTDDYLLWSAPKATNGVIVQPTVRARAGAGTFAQIFKAPPFSSGTAGITPGSPANYNPPPFPATPTWVDVEVAQVGNTVTLRINRSTILQSTNNSAATNGNIMLGYDDAFDSLGNSPGVIYDNVRVVRLFPPTILTQPTSATTPIGGTTNFTVVATGTTTGFTNYQWRLNNVAIPGATNATITFGSVQLTNYGTYTVVFSDGAYSVTSTAVTLLPPVPAIITPPSSQAAAVGGTAAFSVVATTTTGTTNYQWMLNATNVAGASYSGVTNANLSINPVLATSFGPYRVRVSDGFTTVTSIVANLTVAVQPTITNSLSGSTLNLIFPTEIGPKYVVEWKGALTNGTWNQLVTNTGTGSPITVPESTLTDAQRFYRVRMQ